MTTQQQQEALEYFRSHAANWRAKADGLIEATVNIIEQRNGYVRLVASERPATATSLDVGCGTGELVCDLARSGVDAVGVDYAPEMVELATRKAEAEGLPNASFALGSIFDYPMPAAGFDLISANGFIEYISLEQLHAFFDLVAQALAPGGSFVVGSRNRLFNLVSLNDFTLQELEGPDFALLLREAVAWTSADGLAEADLSQCAALQVPETVHRNTGVKVATRFQYTPFQLIGLLAEHGLKPVEVYPVHIHGVTPAFGRTGAEVHVSIANMLQAYARHNTQLLAHASSFMLHVRRTD